MRTTLALAMMLALAACAAWAQQTSAPSYTVRKVSRGPVNLQAFTDRPWSNAQVVEWGPDGYKTTFRALWADRDLWLRFDVQDPAPWHTMTKRDEHLWEEEVVELFIDLDGTGKNYAEYEISPANVLCDVRMESGVPNVKSILEWDHAGIESAVRMRAGSGADPGGWTAILRLPWRGFRSLPAVTEGRAKTPPRPGDAWRFNLYRIERPHGPADPKKDAVFAAWIPTGTASFHNPAVFRPLIFAPQ
ncbi:MAG: carbohydrate-binding family 9-like protein [Bryobacterales bacterium]|nr:carbohydrate-binding family 9-like protein [Bryobacterales bacterium]